MPSRKTTHVRILVAVLLLAAFVAPTPADTQSLETLLAYLKSPNAETRRDAARKLGERRIRDPLAVDALAVAARRDESREVRDESIKSLGLIKDFSALPEMLDGLRDTQREVRMTTVRSLVALYSEHDIDFITNRRTGWNRLNPFLDTDDHEIIEPYRMVEPSIIKSLGDAARGDFDRDVRIAAVRALGVLRGRDAIPQLADALNADQDVRVDVIRALIKMGDAEAGRYLVPFFRDTDEKVRNQAIFATGFLKYRGAVQPLLSVYGRGPEERSKIGVIKNVFSPMEYRDKAALLALATIGDERAEQVFVENLTDKDKERRQYAAEGLARIGEKRYLDQLSRLVLTEKDKDAKLAQQWALYRLGERDQIRHLVPRLDSGQQDQAYAYLMETDNVIDLHPYARSSNPQVKRKVIEILGKIGDQATIAELQPIATSSGAETSDTATLAIKRIEWRIAGKPRASDDVLKRQTRPRRSGNLR